MSVIVNGRMCAEERKNFPLLLFHPLSSPDLQIIGYFAPYYLLIVQLQSLTNK